LCGRAKLPDDASEIKLDLTIDWDAIGTYQPRWNAAPTSKLPVVISRNGDRMPVLLTPEHWAVWLGETAANDAQLKAVLKPYPSAGMVFGRWTGASAMFATTVPICSRRFLRRTRLLRCCYLPMTGQLE
jgi:putative SOS response-associated peptidase YedK